MKSNSLYAAVALLALSAAAIAQGPPPAAVPEGREPRSVAVYVSGGLSDGERAAVGNALLAALVNSGAAVAHPYAAGFVSNADGWVKQKVAIDDNRLSELGRYYGIKYILAASVSPAFGAPPGNFTVFARMLNTATGKARLTGDAVSPLKTAEDLAAAANAVVEKMIGKRAPAAPPPPPPLPEPAAPPTEAPQAAATETQPPAADEPAVSAAPAAPEQPKLAVAVYMAGEEPEGAEGVHNIMGGELARVLSESDKYTAVDRTEAIVSQLDKEHVYQRSGAVDDDQIKAIGHQLGVQYLCISNINPAGRRYYLDTRFVDIVSAEILRSVTATSTLKDAAEMTRVGREIALDLLEADKTRRQRRLKKIIFQSTAAGLDALSALAFTYGYLENDKVVKAVKDDNGPEATRAATRRNTAYIISGALLASGVAIHITF